MMREFTVAIVGGGASGVLSALALMRRSPLARAIVIDPSAQIGRGVAYSTECRLHLLNVPAGRMSAFPDQPEHFVRWLHDRVDRSYDANSFVPRWIYGSYLSALAADAQGAAGSRWRRVGAQASSARLNERGVSIACSNGETIEADAMILASGNPPPAEWRAITPQARDCGRYFASAWDEKAIVPDDPEEEILLIGTGLTAVDVALGLRYNGHRGTIHMVSRRGLLPHEHRLFPAPSPSRLEAATLRPLGRELRGNARKTGTWRAAIDGIRAQENALWQALTTNEQRSFLRHAMPYWSVHRHRMAPGVTKMIAELMAQGTLNVLAGRIGEIALADDALRVPIRVRGCEETELLEVDRVINCSGPQYDLRKVANPLMRSLLDQGLMTSSPLNMGARVAADGALVGADGTPSNRLFSIGPVRYGTLIETTAMPEIRVQAQELAETLVAHFAEMRPPAPPEKRKGRTSILRSRVRRISAPAREFDVAAYTYEI